MSHPIKTLWIEECYRYASSSRPEYSRLTGPFWAVLIHYKKVVYPGCGRMINLLLYNKGGCFNGRLWLVDARILEITTPSYWTILIQPANACQFCQTIILDVQTGPDNKVINRIILTTQGLDWVNKCQIKAYHMIFKWILWRAIGKISTLMRWSIKCFKYKDDCNFFQKA